MRKTNTAFNVRHMYTFRRPAFKHLAKQRVSFVIALFTLFSFVIGNMVGQNGFYAFSKSVFGEEAYLQFAGTVAPIRFIPDNQEWATYGGDFKVHTYNQAPQNVLKPLPTYNRSELAKQFTSNEWSLARQAYTTLWNGGYDSAVGSHPGTDMPAPRGTPVNSIANGVVEKVGLTNVGFGNYALIKHTNVPDLKNPSQTATYYSTYAHMDVVLVHEGEIVQKGQQIGTVGNTGLSFGNHLYFQVELASAPYHPYWPFTSSEASAAGMTFIQAVNKGLNRERVAQYTVDPMEFVQKYANYSGGGAVAQSQSIANSMPPQMSRAQLAKLARDQRITDRKSRATQVAASRTTVAQSTSVVSTPSIPAPVKVATNIAAADTSTQVVSATTNTDVSSLEIRHDGSFKTGVWENVTITALDNDGKKVVSPSFQGDIYIRPDFNTDTIVRPDRLSTLDFERGVATIQVFSRTPKTIFITTKSSNTILESRSTPMTYQR